MRYWLQLPQGGWVATRQNVRLYALLAEELGLHGVWVGDHIVIPFGYTSQYPYGDRHPVPPDRPFLEAYTTLAYVAGLTSRIRLAVTVAIGPYRHPLLHAKIVATLDQLAGGRLEVAIGSGWLKEAFAALGADFQTREQSTDEYLDAMRCLWTGEPVAYHGDIVRFETVQCLPRPSQTPHPPLWIGGSGRRAFARLERFDAGWLGPDLPATTFLAKLAALSERRRAAGRQPVDVSAKLWVEPPASRAPGTLSIGAEPPTNFRLLETLSAAGTTEVRLDLSRLPSAERPRQILALARALRKAGLLDEPASASGKHRERDHDA